MRSSEVHTLCAVLLFAGAIAGCQQSPQVAPRAVEPAPPTTTTGRQTGFSADQAWSHLQALTAIGPRVIDTEGSAEARKYIQAQLEKLNLEVHIDERDIMASPKPESDDESEADATGETEPEPVSLFVRNVVATIPGTLGSGSIVLIAPYDTQAFEDFEFVGANDGGSGAAVLLELARVIAANPLPYSTELVFLDGQAPFTLPDGNGSRRKGAGLVRLAMEKREQGAADVHLVVYINRVGDADLHIARDLLSHRIYREEFFDEARRLGQTDAFRPDAPFESTGLKHQPLSAAGIRRIVSIVDTSYGGDEPPGLYAGTEQDTIDHCSPDSLDAVGGVVLAGLETISKRLIKIDLYSGKPVESSPATEQQTESEAVTPDGDDAQH